jgi:Tol biopolymer transport system component/tRNA A-37 threonylcarbamoyl transferase component Bud32
MRLIGQIGHVQSAEGSVPRQSHVVHESLLHPDSSRGASDDNAPVSWGPLHVVEKIGRGRFGDVYRARDPKLDRDVALKLLRHRESDEAIESAVIEEGRFLAKIRHPNVVTVYGAERIDGRVGVWMELVSGRTLEQELNARGRFSPEEVTSIGRDLCGALSAVHRAGLVHRDVKGHNVMRDADGRIVLMDFGTGRELDVAPRAELAGTPVYLAPEVIRGQPASPQSDLYSLGVLLFHLLTGSFPVQGRTLAELRRAHESGRRLMLREQRPDLPSQVAAAIEQALEPRTDARPANAETLARSLVVRATRRQSRTRGIATAAAALVVVVAAGLKWWPGAAEPSPPVPGTTRLVMTSPSFVINDISRDGRFGVGIDRADDTAAANVMVRDLTAGTTEELLHGSPEGYALSPIWSPDGREVAYRWTRRRAGGEVNFPSALMVRSVVTGPPARTLLKEDADKVITPVGWRPDGTAILAQVRPRFAGQRTRDSSLVWVSIADGSIETIRAFKWWQRAGLERPRLSPDGQRIVYAANVRTESTERHIYVIDSDGRNEREIAGLAGISDEPVWSPDGRRVFFVSNRSGEPGLWSAPVDATDGPKEPVIVKAGFTGSPIAITTSGALYFSRKSGGESMVFISDRHPSATSAVQMFMGDKPQWSGDGTAIAMTRLVKYDGAVIVKTMATGREQSYPHIGLSMNPPRWLAGDRELLVHVQAIGDNGRPGGSYFALDFKSAAFKWRFAKNSTSHVRGSPSTQSADGSAVYMPYRGSDFDSPWAGIVAINPANGREKVAVTFPRGTLVGDPAGGDMGLALSPDGKTLAMMSWANASLREARLMLVGTDGRHLRHLYGPFPADFMIGALKWAPDGQSILFVVTHSSGLIQVMRISPNGGAPIFDGVDSRILTRSAPSLRLQPHGGLTLDVSPDGTKVLLAISIFAEWETWAMDGVVPMAKAGPTISPAR